MSATGEGNARGTPPAWSQAPEAAMPPAGSQKTLRDYWIIILRRWWIGLIIGMAAGGAFWWKNSQEVPLYRARAVIIFDQETDRILNIEEVVSSSLRGLVDTILRNHHSIMMSNGFRVQVVETLTPEEKELIVGPYRDPETNPEPSVHGIIAGANRINRAGDNVFSIEFVHRSGEAAALLANRFVEQYNQYLINRKREGNTSAMRFLRARAEELRLRVEQSELEVQKYRNDKGLVSLEENQNLVVKRLQALDSSLIGARIRLLELQNELNLVESTLAAGKDVLELPIIASFGSISSLLEQLSTLRTVRSTLSLRYGRRHPRMIENETATQSVEKELAANRDLAIAQIRNQVASQEGSVRELEASLRAAEKESLELDRMAIEYNVLRRKLEGDRGLFDQILSRLNETTVASQLTNTNLRVVDLAAPSAQPISPDTKNLLAQSIALFMACFVGIPFALEFFDKKIKSYKDIELHLRRLHLGNIPRVSAKKVKGAGNPFLDNQDKFQAEWYRTIYSQMEVYSRCSYPKIILVTSSLPHEGKSYILSHFAVSLSRHHKKVLVVDADFRNPSQHHNFGVENSSGLVNWFRQRDATRPPMLDPKRDFPSIVHLARRLYFMPVGLHDEYPSEILTSKSLEDLFSRLKSEYDVILVDSPPAGVFPDAALLTKLCDEILYVVKYKAISRILVRQILRDLEQSKAKFLGVVLNYAKEDVMGKSSYYSKYRKYYDRADRAEKAEKQKKEKKGKSSKQPAGKPWEKEPEQVPADPGTEPDLAPAARE